MTTQNFRAYSNQKNLKRRKQHVETLFSNLAFNYHKTRAKIIASQHKQFKNKRSV